MVLDGYYVKLQDAYAAESNQLGTWTLIGYTAPGTKASADEFSTTVFKYTGGISEAASLETAVTKDNAWVAEALTALNDCAKGKKWVIKVTGKPEGVTYENSLDATCEPLTPSFKNIGTKAAAATGNGGN